MKTSIKSELLGSLDPSLFVAAFIAALVGVLFTLLVGSTLRSVKSVNSPEDFSWSYLLSDNAKRIYANILVIIVTLRFMPEVLGVELSVWKGFIVGVSYDALALIVKQKTKLLDSKQ
jgi:hypothetical protein